jgi:hypothetical protein
MRMLGRFLVTVVALVGISAAAMAQTRIRVGVGGGLAQPMGDFGDGYKMGWVAAGGIRLEPEGWRLALRAVGSYGQFNAEGNVDASVKPLVLTGGVALPLTTRGSVVPYVAGGAGFASTKASATVGNVTVSDTETNFAWNLGGGLTFGRADGSGVRFLIEVSWTSIATEGSATNYVPVLAIISIPLGSR